MAKKTVYNINEMSKALVIAHNTGNLKPINTDLIDGCGIDRGYFTKWVADCQKLLEACHSYYEVRTNFRNGLATEDDMKAARIVIYPLWKSIIEAGETNKFTKELHVHESDVEDLVGFSWKFFSPKFNSGKGAESVCSIGTQIVCEDDKKFRQKVESLVGCIMAKNRMLTNTERDTLDTYYKALNSAVSATEKIAETQVAIDDWNKKLAELKPEEAEFAKYIKNQVRILTEDLEKAKKDKAEADFKANQYKKDATEIEGKIKTIKIDC